MPQGYWSVEKIKAELAHNGYTTRSEFRRGVPGAYMAARRDGLLDSLFPESVGAVKPRGYWNLANVKREIAEQGYLTRREFRLGSPGAYASALKQAMLDQLFPESILVKNPKNYWSLEKCRAEACQYTTRNSWAKGHIKSYAAARKYGWIDACCGHMKKPIFPRGHWAKKEHCVESARQFRTRKEWQTAMPGAYASSLRHRWLDECCEHMVLMRKPKGTWTKENCIAEARRHTCVTDWLKRQRGCYMEAYRQGWLEECCKHMAPRRISDRDVIYIWEAVGQTFNMKPVYKIGVTSERLGEARMKKNAQKMGFGYKLVAMEKTSCAASELEALLHDIGSNPDYVEGDGKTEFRALSDAQLAEVLEWIVAFKVT